VFKSHVSRRVTRSRFERNVLLSRGGIVGRLVHHQRRCAATVEEVDCGALAIVVGRFKRSIEILCQIDGRSVECGVGIKNPRNGIVVGLGVVADDGGIDKKGQKGVLIGSVIIFQQRGRVVVTVLCISICFPYKVGYTYQMDVLDGRWARPEPTMAATTKRLLKNMMVDGVRGGKQIRKVLRAFIHEVRSTDR
jgi:hypothetical protein